jgi:hypothetical protein
MDIGIRRVDKFTVSNIAPTHKGIPVNHCPVVGESPMVSENVIDPDYQEEIGWIIRAAVTEAKIRDSENVGSVLRVENIFIDPRGGIVDRIDVKGGLLRKTFTRCNVRMGIRRGIKVHIPQCPESWSAPFDLAYVNTCAI